MEQRKLIKLGNSSFAIALPKAWIDKSGLKKGDKIFLEENGNGELNVTSSPSKNNNKEITVDVNNKDLSSIKREIRAAYIRGYDILKIDGAKERSTRTNIKNILGDFLSFDMVEGKEESILLKDFFNIEEANMQNFIRRMDNNIKEILDISLEELKKPEINQAKIKEVESIDKDVNKFYFLCSRVFLKGIDNPSVLTTLKTSGIKIFNEWWFAYNLEALSDYIKYVLRDSQKINIKKIKDKLTVIFTDLRTAYLKCMESFYKEDAKLASEVIDITKKLTEEIEILWNENPTYHVIFKDLNQIRRQIYQNAKMIFYLKY